MNWLADFLMGLFDRITGKVKVAQRERALQDVASAKVIVEEMEADKAELDKILSDNPAVPPPLPVKPS